MKMLSGIFFGLFLASLATAYNPDLIESAPYTVVEVKDGYEIRDVPVTKWVSTDGYELQIHDGDQHGLMFDKLFHYIDGGNAEGAKIDMTAPVLYFIIPGAGPNCESNFTMSFLIPEIYQENPILPTADDVYIEERPAMRVASYNFSGYANDADWIAAGVELYDLATSQGDDVFVGHYFNAGYDSPFTIANRLNEVWFLLRE